MSTNPGPRSNMQPTTDKQGSVSAKPLFLRSRIPRAPVSARTPVDRQPIVPPQITKPRKSRHSDRRDSNRVQKNREIEKPQDPRAALAEKFAENLDQYRESLHTQATSDLSEIQSNLAGNLQELSVDVEAHFQKLSDVEEPLQRPFAAEALTKVQPNTDASAGRTYDVLLQDSVSDFRSLKKEKGAILRKLWEEWEEAQFEIMTLAVELFGKDSLSIEQLDNGDHRASQQEKLGDMFKAGQNAYDESHRYCADFRQDLKTFEDSTGQISNEARKTAKDIHEACLQKKAAHMKALTTLIRKITED